MILLWLSIYNGNNHSREKKTSVTPRIISSKLQVSSLYLRVRSIMFYYSPKTRKGNCVQKPRCCCGQLPFLKAWKGSSRRMFQITPSAGSLQREETFLKTIKDDSSLQAIHRLCFITEKCKSSTEKEVCVLYCFGPWKAHGGTRCDYYSEGESNLIRETRLQCIQ